MSLEKEIKKIRPSIEQFAHQQINEQEFLEVLFEAERKQGWRFALDGNRLQIRDKEKMIVLVFDLETGAITTQESLVPSLQNIQLPSLIQRVKKENTEIVGISGPARRPIDETYVDEKLRDIYSHFDPENTLILTGGYPGGVPYEAQRIAIEMSFDVIAVVPQVIFQPQFLDFPRRFIVTVTKGENWGDETPYFASSIDQLFVFEGGGLWTDFERDLAIELGKPITLIPQRDRQGVLD